MKKLFIPFLFLSLSFFLSSCEQPLTFEKKETVTVYLPSWPQSEGYPPITCWKISVTTENSFYEITKDKTCTSFDLSFIKDKPASITAQPLININGAENFFYPAAVLYPFDFEKSEASFSWNRYAAATALQNVLKQENSYKKTTALNYFNWKKLEETLIQKDSDAFSKYDSLSTKKCTTSINTDFETLHSRILEPPSRFYIPYFDTSSVAPEKIKNLKLSEGSQIFHQYIPLNELTKEKGCITVQVKPENHKTALLINGQIFYIRNKALYLE